MARCIAAPRRRARFLLPALLLPLLLASSSPSDGKVRVEGIVNPHSDPEACGSCHSGTPTAEEAAKGEYRLLAESIDATCHICHTKMCCEVNALHRFDHPSNVNRWDTAKFRRPKTLPLHDGYITCSTCHRHEAAKDGERCSMVRICRRTETRVEWIDLCKDCHTGY